MGRSFSCAYKRHLTIYRQKCRRICDILRFYLVAQHYFSIFAAEFATLDNMFRCIKYECIMYIHERDNWTDFRWDTSQVSLLQEKVFRKQGLLYGRLSSLGFDSKLRAMAENLTYDVVYSSRKLGIENVKYTAPSHYVDSVVGVMLEAVQHYDLPLSKEKLCAWQTAFFPSGYSEGSQIEIGQYRTNEEHIVSGRFSSAARRGKPMFGREKIHYIAPSPDRVVYRSIA